MGEPGFGSTAHTFPAFSVTIAMGSAAQTFTSLGGSTRRAAWTVTSPFRYGRGPLQNEVPRWTRWERFVSLP